MNYLKISVIKFFCFLLNIDSNNELNTMIGRFMESYHEYMGDNPDSLIARVYGIYTVIIK